MPETIIRYGDLAQLSRHYDLLSRCALVRYVEIQDVADRDILALRIVYRACAEVRVELDHFAQEASGTITRLTRERITMSILQTQEGRSRLASLAESFRQQLDYAGIARRALVVDPLPEGAVPVFEGDLDVAQHVLAEEHVYAYTEAEHVNRPAPHRNTLGKYADLITTVFAPDDRNLLPRNPFDWGWWEGGWWGDDVHPAGYWVYSDPWWYLWRRQIQQSVLTDRRMDKSIRQVTVPMFEIESSPTIAIADVREHRFNLIERPQSLTQSLTQTEVVGRGGYSKSMDQWRPKDRHLKHFMPMDQEWPEWVQPGAHVRSTCPGMGVATVVEVHNLYLTLNWKGSTQRWSKHTGWFHDHWQYEEAPPTLWERLSAA